MLISSTLKNWYLQKKRNLPWRNSLNPYHIWISEVILQQTQVIQGLEYFNRFIGRFPDIYALANADTEEILKLWQGLGYYSRARNLHVGAKYVVQQFKGQIPSDYNDLLKIKGVGEYTAAAIASIAFNAPYPVVDGNVNRVIARLMGVHDPINSSLGIKRIKDLATSIFDPHDPGTYNQAIMEFGALQCRIKNPVCDECPLQQICYAWLHNEVTRLPVKIRPVKQRNRYFHYLVIFSGNDTYIQKRTNNDIWEGLYEFPLYESVSKINCSELQTHDGWNQLFKVLSPDLSSGIIVEAKRHLLSHQIIHATFYILQMADTFDFSDKYLRINRNDMQHYPVSKLIDNFIGMYGSRV